MRHLPTQAAEVGPHRWSEELVHGVRVWKVSTHIAIMSIVARFAANTSQLRSRLQMTRVG